MHQKLREILKVKEAEVSRLKKRALSSPGTDIPPLRDFKRAISTPDRIHLIAEIKFASPSAGMIREKVDPVSIARVYEECGASAISFLTDETFFKGDLTNLPLVKKAVPLPILRKDFIIDEVQIREALLYGADAVLLIARILPLEKLRDFIVLCREQGLTPLTEIHDRKDLEKALQCEADVIGINNRDLDRFEVDINRTNELAPLIPEDRVLVSESGIHDGDDVRAFEGTRIRAVLVGSALMKSKDPAKKIKEMVKAGTGG
jgi:indole-3-glycerol phosphate synthase